MSALFTNLAELQVILVLMGRHHVNCIRSGDQEIGISAPREVTTIAAASAPETAHDVPSEADLEALLYHSSCPLEETGNSGEVLNSKEMR
jgi:hypothetical protein